MAGNFEGAVRSSVGVWDRVVNGRPLALWRGYMKHEMSTELNESRETSQQVFCSYLPSAGWKGIPLQGRCRRCATRVRFSYAGPGNIATGVELVCTVDVRSLLVQIVYVYSSKDLNRAKAILSVDYQTSGARDTGNRRPSFVVGHGGQCLKGSHKHAWKCQPSLKLPNEFVCGLHYRHKHWIPLLSPPFCG